MEDPGLIEVPDEIPVWACVLFCPIWMIVGIEMMFLLLLAGILFHRDENGKINVD